MTQTLPPSVQSRVDVVMNQLREVDMSDGQRWHVENAVINAAREAMAQARTAGRLEGAGKALAFVFHAMGRIRAPDLTHFTPLTAFIQAKTLCDATLCVIGDQIHQGRLSLGGQAAPTKLDDILPDFSAIVQAGTEPTPSAAPPHPQPETEGEGV